jgi:Putative peptidoglycan binding domain
MAEALGRSAVISAGAIVLLAGAGWAAYSADLLRTHPAHAATPAIATNTAPVVRTTVRQETSVTGTLGYSGSYAVIAPATGSAATGSATTGSGTTGSGTTGSGTTGSGTTGGGGPGGVITWLPAPGAAVYRGKPVYEVNGQPVPLFYGSRPAWRDLYLGVTDGPDVRQLKRNLVALGYTALGYTLAVDDTFDLATEQAVESWQQAAGLPVTGTVPLGQVVFLPGPLVVSQQVAAVGGPVPAGTPILQGTGGTPDVQVQLDPSAAPGVRPGNQVFVTLPDGTTDPGTVTRVSRVAVTQPQGAQQGQQSQQGQQALIPVTIQLRRTVRGVLDQAPVQVAIVSAEHANVLAVPITALLAQPGGQFAVVVVDGNSRRTVGVQAGLFDETAGDVEVSGGLAAGELVAVPSQ